MTGINAGAERADDAGGLGEVFTHGPMVRSSGGPE
jgi:hypothetical protein